MCNHLKWIKNEIGNTESEKLKQYDTNWFEKLTLRGLSQLQFTTIYSKNHQRLQFKEYIINLLHCIAYNCKV